MILALGRTEELMSSLVKKFTVDLPSFKAMCPHQPSKTLHLPTFISHLVVYLFSANKPVAAGDSKAFPGKYICSVC